MKLRHLRGAFALVALALTAGCATVPSVPLTDVRPLVGKWRGTISVGLGPPQFYYLTVNPDASIVATWGPNWQWGNITLNGGRARFELSHLTSGTLLRRQGRPRHHDDSRLRRLVRLRHAAPVA